MPISLILLNFVGPPVVCLISLYLVFFHGFSAFPTVAIPVLVYYSLLIFPARFMVMRKIKLILSALKQNQEFAQWSDDAKLEVKIGSSGSGSTTLQGFGIILRMKNPLYRALTFRNFESLLNIDLYARLRNFFESFQNRYQSQSPLADFFGRGITNSDKYISINFPDDLWSGNFEFDLAAACGLMKEIDGNLKILDRHQVVFEPIEPRSSLSWAWRIILIALLIAFGMKTFSGEHQAFGRSRVLREGTPTMSVVTRKSIAGMHFLLNYSYQTRDGRSFAGSSPVSYNTERFQRDRFDQVHIGQQVPIFYMADHPEMTVLDDDLGYSVETYCWAGVYILTALVVAVYLLK